MWPIQLTQQSEQTFKLYDLFKSNQWVTSRINLSSGGNYYMHLREIGRLANQLPHWVLTFDPPGEGPLCFQLTVLIFFYLQLTSVWPWTLQHSLLHCPPQNPHSPQTERCLSLLSATKKKIWIQLKELKWNFSGQTRQTYNKSIMFFIIDRTFHWFAFLDGLVRI